MTPFRAPRFARLHTLTGLGVAAALLAPGLAGADAPQHLTLDYDGRLYLKVLELKVQQDSAGGAFTSSARLTTYGVLALFRKLDMRAEGHGRIEGGAAQPGVFAHFNASNKKPRHVTATWANGDVIATSNPQYPNMGDPPSTKAQRLEAADPLTVAMRIAMTPAASDPCHGVLKFYDGKQRYDAILTPDGTRTLEGREKSIGLTAPVKCRLQYREVAGFRRKPAAEQGEGLKKHVDLGFARIGATGPWVISYARAGTQLGEAEIVLAKVTGQ